MENENRNNQVVRINDADARFDANILAFEKVKSLVDYLSKSDTFSKGFEERDKGGNIIYDDDTKKPKINSADMAIALMVGHNLGLDLASSLVIGSKLNQRTYLAILKGRELGFDIATSMEKIYSIPTKNGIISYTGVDIISAKLLQGGINFLPLVKSYAPFYTYYNFLTKEELDLDQILDDNDNLKPEYFVYTPNVTPNDVLAKKVSEGIRVVQRIRNGYYSKVMMTRSFKDGRSLKISKRFSTVDAQRAGLLPTYDDKGNLIDGGKDNWNSNTPQMLDNRVITIAGRIIGADLIQGLYSKEEALEIPEVKRVIDTEYVKDSE